MPRNDTPQFASQIESALAAVRNSFGGNTNDALATAASVTSYRARRLEVAQARLTEKYGDDHPRVVALQVRREQMEGVGRALVRERERAIAEKPLRPGEWLATGRVLDSEGAPLAGFQVIVFDEDKGPDDPLGDELTDKAGEFRAEYHQRDFADEDGEEFPQLSLVVFDRSGKPVFESERSVRANSSRRDRFEILLSRERLENGVERDTCAGVTAAGEPCKNRARPGTKFCKLHTPR